MADNSPNTVSLVKAIISRVQERDGYVTKTKLFKYLYLIDVEWYRAKRKQFTSFHWMFFHYGPWSSECERMYAELERYNEIEVKPGNRSDLDTEFVSTRDHVEFEKVIDDFYMERTVRRIVDTWADRKLGDMLDYVYFRTEPMENAERGKPLDFEKIEPVTLVGGTSMSSGAGTDAEEWLLLSTRADDSPRDAPYSSGFVADARMSSLPHYAFTGLEQPTKRLLVDRALKIISERKRSASTEKHDFTPPPYDDLYYDAVNSMKDDDD